MYTSPMAILNIYKPLGWTPLEAIVKYKELHPDLKDVPMTYAGRLDPMAEGVLIILSAEDVHNKQKFLNLPKTYKAEILFGFSTDSCDLMGLVTQTDKEDVIIEEVEKAVKKFEGKIALRVPPYSSVPVEGKPLFEWAQKNLLHKIKIPRSKTTIHSINLTSFKEITKIQILEKLEVIKSVNGDFRKEEILNSWTSALSSFENDNFQIALVEVFCSSGTYVRSIARELGQKLGTESCLFSLIRNSVGEYNIGNSIPLDKLV